MSESDHQIDSPLSLQDRKQLLILACAADRTAWQDSCRPRPRPPVARIADVLCLFVPLLSLVPGLPERWVTRLAFLTKLARQFGLFVA